MTAPHYVPPGRLENVLLHRAVAWLAQHGVPLNGKGVLAVRGRKSGQWRTNPVNPMPFAGTRYLVAPRGRTEWVRNLRAADGHGELRRGRRVEAFTATELRDEEKPEVLRAYLRRWGWEVGRFFDGVSSASTDAELLRVADRHPVFRVTPRDPLENRP